MIPREARLSVSATDLIRKLIADPQSRLGQGGAEEIKAHPFFAGIDWTNLRRRRAPWVPELQGEADAQHFETFQESEPFYPADAPERRRHKRKDVNFIGFTYKYDSSNQRSGLVNALQELEMVSGRGRLPIEEIKEVLEPPGDD